MTTTTRCECCGEVGELIECGGWAMCGECVADAMGHGGAPGSLEAAEAALGRSLTTAERAALDQEA